MSKNITEILKCPKCNQEHPFTVWQSINTTLDPEMKAAVLDRSALLFECPSCGKKRTLIMDFSITKWKILS